MKKLSTSIFKYPDPLQIAGENNFVFWTEFLIIKNCIFFLKKMHVIVKWHLPTTWSKLVRSMPCGRNQELGIKKQSQNIAAGHRRENNGIQKKVLSHKWKWFGDGLNVYNSL